MPELIDANVLKSELCSVCDMRDCCVTVCETIRIINKQHTIKAKPVWHGRWETIDPSFANVYCSECGAAADKHLAKRYKGCPFCLCVMDTTDTNVDGKGGTDNES